MNKRELYDRIIEALNEREIEFQKIIFGGEFIFIPPEDRALINKTPIEITMREIKELKE